jgi:hypothetical protein
MFSLSSERTTRTADHVGERFDRRSGVDVADDRQIGIRAAQLIDSLLDPFRGCRVGELTTREHVWKQYRPRGIHDFRGLGHEMDATETDDVRIPDLCRHERELERIADEIRRLQDLGPVIVVGDDDRVALFLQCSDLFVQTPEALGILLGVLVGADPLQLLE